jgi:hypothetical protein
LNEKGLNGKPGWEDVFIKRSPGQQGIWREERTNKQKYREKWL